MPSADNVFARAHLSQELYFSSGNGLSMIGGARYMTQSSRRGAPEPNCADQKVHSAAIAKTCVQPDVLSDSLGLLQIKGRVASLTEACTPWGLSLPPASGYFHVIARGTVWVQRVGEKTAVQLEAGDFVIFPHGHAHSVCDAPGRPTVPVMDLFDDAPDGILRIGGQGALSEFVCGDFIFEGAEGHPLMEALPPLLHIKRSDADLFEWRDVVPRFLLHEVRNRRLGAEASVSRLVELLFVQSVRTWLEAQPEGSGGWLGALRDPILREVIRNMHQRPARNWTLASLAAEVGVSRSTVAARFRSVIGSSPMNYLARWRLLLAARLLRTEDLSVRDAAERVGYGAEAAFSRAFKRQFGVAPATYRQRFDITEAAAG